MSVKTFLWIEDRKGKASYTFWKTIMSELYPDIIVESKKNNHELVKAISKLQDKENRYIIVLDNSFDNVQVYMEQKQLMKAVLARDNVCLMNLICFEYVLLEFDQLIDWIYAKDDEFLKKRESAILARNKLVTAFASGDLNYKAIREVMEYDKNLNDHNIEQISAKLLFELTRNTGFEVSKGKIGDCWIKSCCEWFERQEDDMCGLDSDRLLLTKKMRSIYWRTSLHKEFFKLGLEVS